MNTVNQLASTLLAQAPQGPSLPGAPAAPAAGTATDAAGTATQGAPAGGGSFMVMLIVLMGAMILFSFVSARREKKKREQLLGNIKKHDKVLTVGGILGSVVELKDDSVVLKVDETSNTRITFAKSAISQVMPQDSAA
jgi:preprotein translocase subunit YajC